MHKAALWQRVMKKQNIRLHWGNLLNVEQRKRNTRLRCVIYPIFVKSTSFIYPVAPVPVPLLSHFHLCPFMCFLLLLFLFSVPNPCLQFFHFWSPISVPSICSCSLFLFLFLVSFDTWFITFYLNPILILARPDFVYKLSMSIIVRQFVNYLIPLSVSSPITSSYSLLFKVDLY